MVDLLPLYAIKGMDIGNNIRQIREAKGLSQKELVSAIGMGAPMYSRIETGKTEPSLSSLEKIARALGVGMCQLFEAGGAPVTETRAYDASPMERLRLIDTLSEEEKRTVFTIVDAFVGKKKLKDALSGALADAK